MGNFCARDNSPGRQPHHYNNNAAPKGGNDRYARIGDEYETLDQVRSIDFFPCPRIPALISRWSRVGSICSIECCCA